jgi:hypothetical protein
MNEQTAIAKVALPFLGHMVPRRVAKGGFMLIHKDKLGREHRDQHRTIPELVAARDKLPKHCRLGNGRWDTKFAVIVADDVFLDAQDMVCAWAPESIAKLEQAEGQRRQSERSDLARHGSVRKMHKQGTPAFKALVERPTVTQAQPQSVRAIRQQRRSPAATGTVADRFVMPAYAPWVLIVGGLLMWLSLWRAGGSYFEHGVAVVAMFGGAGLRCLKPRSST